MNSRKLLTRGLLLVMLPAGGWAQGVNTAGASGGLVIPSPEVLPSGSVVLSTDNHLEPKLGRQAHERSYSLGMGLFPGLELFGRISEYTSPVPGGPFFTGVRDLSANAKLQLPKLWRNQPQMAVGVNDVSGGASFFNSQYLVVGDQLGPVRWTFGYARSSKPAALHGAFGGVQWQVGETGLTALAEYDGRAKHAGVRYASPAIDALGDARLVGTVQRSFGATTVTGAAADATTVGLSLVMPFGARAEKAVQGKPQWTLPPISPAAGAATHNSMPATRQDRLDQLFKALQAVGLERVRVGAVGRDLVLQYENHRYNQNEADALGLALGLGAELAPSGTQRVYAQVLKAGQMVYESSVSVSEYRSFLRDGDASQVKSSLVTERQATFADDAVQWAQAAPSSFTRVRVDIKPELAHTIATEVGLYDYALAANVQATAPLWKGGELFASAVKPLAHSSNMEPSGVYHSMVQRGGLKALAVQQGFWLGRNAYAQVGAGRYRYTSWGVQGEGAVFVPGREDTLRLRAGVYQKQEGQTARQAYAGAASYRWVPVTGTWLEAGFQQYTDGSRGPSLGLTRWFGDVAVQVYYRKGGERQFAGLEMSFPLTPRQGMAPNAVTLGGSSQFATGIRTRLTLGSQSTNNVSPSAVRELLPDYALDAQQLNNGRTGEKYFVTQVFRMREAFFLYGKDHLPH